jgi:hypothetical protein
VLRETGDPKISTLIHSTWLWRQSEDEPGWATHHASWPPSLPVEANIALCGFDLQNAAQFTSFEPRFAYAYIETPETPTEVLGGVTIPLANQLTDTTVWLTTTTVTFQLEAQNTTVAAVGMVYDTSDAVGHALPVAQTLDLAVHDENGRVVGTHREVQLGDQGHIDIDQVRESVLTRARTRSDRSLRTAVIDLSQLRAGDPFAIDPATGRPVPKIE